MERVDETHEALRLGREKKIPGSEVLSRLVAGQVIVPLRDMPAIEDNVISGWDPAILGKPDGTHWVAAFTMKAHLDAFCSANPEYATYLTIDTRWVVTQLPANLGIVFNPQTADMLQWSAAGIAKYREDFLAG